MAVPALPLQLVHESDVGSALLQCVVGAGPAGAYNIAGDGVLTAVDVARALAPLPLLPSVAEWVEAFGRPAIMDTTKAKEQLGWQPHYTGLEALQDTLR